VKHAHFVQNSHFDNSSRWIRAFQGALSGNIHGHRKETSNEGSREDGSN
jgi:hypothetical protein